MRKCALLIGLTLGLGWQILGQDPASMSSPRISTTAGAINFITRFSTFAPGGDYRLGVGTRGQRIRRIKMELLQGNKPLPKRRMTFPQGLAGPWFHVNEILVQGFVFRSAELPTQGEEFVLKVTIPRAEAEALGQLFVVLARRLVKDRWHIVDGTEINQTHWRTR